LGPKVTKSANSGLPAKKLAFGSKQDQSLGIMAALTSSITFLHLRKYTIKKHQAKILGLKVHFEKNLSNSAVPKRALLPIKVFYLGEIGSASAYM
jgi:hypothetical protein